MVIILNKKITYTLIEITIVAYKSIIIHTITIPSRGFTMVFLQTVDIWTVESGSRGSSPVRTD